MDFDSFNLEEEIQKKVFIDSSILHCEGSKYIYPYTMFYKDIKDNSINRLYKRNIKRRMFNIYDNSDRVLDMIENMNDRKALEYLKKLREIRRKQLLKEYAKEETSRIMFERKYNVNILNYKEKLKNEIYKKRKGTKIMYALMELLLNRPKREKTFKINKRIDMLYSSQKNKNYSSLLNKITNKKNNNISQTSKNTKNYRNINIINKNFPLTKDNALQKEKKIEYNPSAIRKSKSLSNVKSLSKKYLFEKHNIDNIRGKTIFMKKNLLNRTNEFEYPQIKDNISFSNSFNKENLSNLSIDNNNEKSEFSFLKKRLEKIKMDSSSDLTINFPDYQRKAFLNKMNYINKNRIENMIKKFDFNKNKELINNSQSQIYTRGINFQKNKRSLLLNLKKLTDKAEEISQQITKSFMSEYKINLKDETENKNKRKILFIKKNILKNHLNSKYLNDNKENNEKPSPNKLLFKSKSNFSLFQKNGRFLKRKIYANENFKHNFSS